MTVGFEIDAATADRLRAADSGSAAAIHPFIGGRQLLHEHGVSRAVIDIATDDADTAWRTAPAAMEHLRATVLPLREAGAAKEATRNAVVLRGDPGARINRHHASFLDGWWRMAYRRGDLIKQLAGMDRYIAVPRVSSEERLTVFTFLEANVHPGDTVVAFTLDDEYSFGVLQSSVHRAWFEARCSTLETRLAYTTSTVFDSFPWPQAPTPLAVTRVTTTARALVDHRTTATSGGRTLAQIYDVLRQPGKSTLRRLHDDLDVAVTAAYGLDPSVDLLAQLLALNLNVNAAEGAGSVVTPPGPVTHSAHG